MVKPLSEVIAPDRAQDARRWDAPSFGEAPPTVGCVEDIAASAFEEGRQQGHADGFAQGRKEGLAVMQAQAAALADCVKALAEPLARQDERLDRTLMELAVEIAGVLACGELRRCPVALRQLVAEAVDSVAPPAREVTVEVHPDRLSMLADALEQAPLGVAHVLRANPELALEDCRVHTDTGLADGTLERRRAELLARLAEGA